MRQTIRKANMYLLVAGLLAALLFLLAGCGGKENSKNFSVSAEKIPAGVFSIVRPQVNKETLFVRGMVQEAYRRYIVARLYTGALVHYDVNKGNAEEHKNLLKKTQSAWKSARDTASVASFYAIGLSRLERTEGWSGYKETAALNEFNLMKSAYAAESEKEKKKKKTDYATLNYKSKDDVLREYSQAQLRKMLDKYPEGKQLLGISCALQIDGKTACDIMNTVNPDYQHEGRTWQDIASDTAYRGASVLKTAGKAAGVGLAAIGTAAATAPAAVVVGGTVVLIKIVDTGLDAVSTGLVVFTGEEDKSLNKALAVTGTADTVASVVTFDLTKPVLGGNLQEGATVGKYLQGNFQGAKETLGLISTNGLKTAAKNINPEGANNAIGVITGLMGLKGNYDTLVVTEKNTEDGKTETRTGALTVQNPEKNDKETAASLDASLDNAQKQAEATAKEREAAKEAGADDYAKAAEAVEKAGGADKYKDNVDKIVEETRKELTDALPGTNPDDGTLDEEIATTAAEESKASGVISGEESGDISGTVSGDVSGEAVKGKTAGDVSGKEDSSKDSGEEANDTASGQEDSGKDSGNEDSGRDSGQVSRNEDKDPKDAPYAIDKVIGAKGSYSAGGYTAYYTLTSGGNGLVINMTVPKAGHSDSATVTYYDPWTGTGTVISADGEGAFSVTGEPGNMTLHIR